MENTKPGIIRIGSLGTSRGVASVILVALIVTALGGFGAGYVVASANAGHTPPEMKVFWDAWNLADSEFYYTKPSVQDRVYGAIQGMMATYKDPYTMFMPPQPAAANNQLMQGDSGGIGALVAQNKDGELVITEAMLGKPAEQAGIQAGDVILEVDGKSIKNMTLSDAVNLIHGPIGTPVKITVRRTGHADPLEFSVKRDQINVYGKILNGNLAYISLSLFNATAPAELRDQISSLLKSKPRALIFDLRGNPGGYLDQAVQVADLFLTDGAVVTEKTSDGEVQKYAAHTGDAAEQIPMLVLIDGNSASASEVVAGALQDRKRALLVGQNSYGKGSVQVINPLSDGSQLRVTHGAWYTPNETPIQSNGKHIGLTPDIPVALPDMPQPGVDPTLNAAITYAQSHF